MNLKEILLTAESLGIDPTPEHMDREMVAEFDRDPVIGMAEASAELDASATSIIGIESAISDGEAALDSIQELKEAASGDLTDTGKEIIAATHESIMASLGLSSVYTAESLTQRGVIATLEDREKGIFASIISMLKKLGEMVTSFLLGLFNNVHLLERYMKAIEQKVRSVQGQTPKERTIPPVLAISTARSSDVSSASAIGKTAIQMTEMADKAVTELQKFQTTFKVITSEKDQAMEKKLGSEYDYSEAMNIDRDATNTQKLGKNGEGNGYLSGKRAFHDDPGQRNQVVKLMGPAPKVTETLTPGEMNFLLKDVRDIIAGLKSVEKKKSTFKSIIGGVITFLSGIRADFSSKQERVARRWSVYLRRQTTSILKNLMAESFKSARALLDYIRASLKQYDVKGFEPEEAAAAKHDPNAPRLGYKEKVHSADWELA